MEIDKLAYLAGLKAGFDRVQAHFPEFFYKTFDELDRPLKQVLQKSNINPHPRFITLFVELWAVAEVARVFNGEPRLNEQQIEIFLNRTAEFINSFTHK
jgi:hypothetical protein